MTEHAFQPRAARAAQPEGQTAPHSRTKKPRSAVKQREHDMLVHKWLRFALQIAFFILAPGVFSGAFNGVKYLFTQIGLIEGLEFTSFVVLLMATLAFTVVFGRFFCGYACAFGTLGDVLYAAFEFLRTKTPIPRLRFPQPLVKVLSLTKFAVLAVICAACVFGVWSSVSNASPWVAFAGITAGSVDGIRKLSFGLLGLVALGMILRERFFCQFLCPLGAVFSLMPVLGFSEFKRNKLHCAKNCGRCHEACPVDIWPDQDALGHGECISCGRCADACPMANVNLVAVERALSKEKCLGAAKEKEARPLRKKKEDWRLLRGTGAGVVLAKAVLLLAVLWAVGATRYLPALPFAVGGG